MEFLKKLWEKLMRLLDEDEPLKPGDPPQTVLPETPDSFEPWQ